MNNNTAMDECGTKECHGNFPKVNNMKYIMFDTRVRSFKNWPKVFSLYQTQSLSESGFFYTGMSDKIECFFCGLRLCHWNDTENPLEHHAVWASNCPFLKMTKGKEFIQQTRERYVVKDEEK